MRVLRWFTKRPLGSWDGGASKARLVARRTKGVRGDRRPGQTVNPCLHFGSRAKNRVRSCDICQRPESLSVKGARFRSHSRCQTPASYKLLAIGTDEATRS